MRLNMNGLFKANNIHHKAEFNVHAMLLCTCVLTRRATKNSLFNNGVKPYNTVLPLSQLFSSIPFDHLILDSERSSINYLPWTQVPPQGRSGLWSPLMIKMITVYPLAVIVSAARAPSEHLALLMLLA